MLTENTVPEMCGDARTVVVLAEQEKNYYCQRCLNHGELNPRKGHKPDCGIPGSLLSEAMVTHFLSVYISVPSGANKKVSTNKMLLITN
uniref:DM domain-containing protein n=1 Tax=Caenorhabditis tropicalis TaxID=1561998 RepID=A0A1I7UFU0_9PELO